MKRYRKYIKVEGIVQGVGFRPFVYRAAFENNIKGWVKNTSDGVYMDIEGHACDVEEFLKALKNSAPPLAKISSIVVEDKLLKNHEEFTIQKSDENKNTMTLISPDIATCMDCERELKDKNNHRYQYPFTNCTNCGPRYSIIKELPYDRSMTTMKDFIMCDSCDEEYENPMDRRFHAQPNACKSCGPGVWIVDNNGKRIESKDPIKDVNDLIKDGRIIGIKGLGGFHLVCDGMNEEAVGLLRYRKKRPTKPFALMMKDIKTVKKYCQVNELEENILAGNRKPILLLDRKNTYFPENIAPGNHKLGVMLPYTPLHYLLFDDDLNVLIMTSANVSGMPILYENDEALEKLKDVVDYFLLHDRKIHIPVDDSVSRVMLGKEQLIRRSRGYVPVPFKIDGIDDALACGAKLNNTLCISKGQFGFLSQYIGDLDNLETYNQFQRILKHFKSIYHIEPKWIAHDLHPDFLSTDFAKKEKGQKVPVQHHHAHIASCMVENNLDERVIGIAFDGTGLGTDGRIWGGEFFICDYENFNRVGHLGYVKMPGGDAAVLQPYRMAISYLYKIFGEEMDIPLMGDLPHKKIKNIIMMLKHNVNCVETSSMGRFFDAVAALLGLYNEITFEGEAAIGLEAAAERKGQGVYKYDIDCVNGVHVVNTDKIIKGILRDMENNIERKSIAGRFHNTIIAFSIEMCKKIREKFKIHGVVLSGGVFQNEIILQGIYNGLNDEGFQVYTHGNIPCNDGGIAIGQLVIANRQLKRRNKGCV